ncbi:MAG: MipA/OmpV family protein [Gallionellaceae bacterium]
MELNIINMLRTLSGLLLLVATQAQADGWQASLGAGAAYVPRYEGSANSILRAAPLLDASYSNGKFFVSVTRGIGYNFSDSKYFQYGVRLGIGNARSESDDARLYGMGNLKYIAEGGVFARTFLGPISLFSNVLGGDYGAHGDVGLSVGIPLGKENRLRLSAIQNWGDTRYMQTYFGVTAAQALASGGVLTAYDATEGTKDVVMSASWVHNFDKSWFSSVGVTTKRLQNSALLSPLTQRGVTNSQSILIGYRF